VGGDISNDESTKLKAEKHYSEQHQQQEGQVTEWRPAN